MFDQVHRVTVCFQKVHRETKGLKTPARLTGDPHSYELECFIWKSRAPHGHNGAETLCTFLTLLLLFVAIINGLILYLFGEYLNHSCFEVRDNKNF